ncbi:hypothetical protein XI07_16000 [Bradyrhizobium sp. CCBAU 11445]|nr:hypothetical protein [Bradyrhizobium sp. CCBAU 11445]MDA9523279.1 hypothetical protein [Bradyrhizobium sp. CCBAU 11434]
MEAAASRHAAQIDVKRQSSKEPRAHIFIFQMSRVAAGVEVFGIAGRTADVLEQEGSPSIVVESNHFPSLITWSQLSPKWIVFAPIS